MCLDVFHPLKNGNMKIKALNRNEGRVLFATIVFKSNLHFEGVGILNSVCPHNTRLFKSCKLLFKPTKSK